MKTRVIAAGGLLAASAVLGVLAVDAFRVEAPAPLPPASAAEATPPPRDDEPTVVAPETEQDEAPPAGAVEVEATPQALPVSLEVPTIGVDTELEQLGLLDDGSLATPVDTDVAGWFQGGPRPGAVGPSVIAGHVSWNGDPSVFFRLTELTEGDRIIVNQEDGREATFEVSRIEQHPKNDFPTVAVYANTTTPELRLITCGGEFDSSTGHFDDNIVVFATQVDA